MTQINSWLEFILQQMAAESYLHRAQSGELELDAVLMMGSNNLPGNQSGADILSGKTRMTVALVDRFLANYDIVDHHANDASGFSATLMRDRQTGDYTLSFRSTEPQHAVEGGDLERDGLVAEGLTPAADGEIAFSGFAFGQLMAMEQYYADLRQGRLTNGTINTSLEAFFANPANQINVTGYSLGGHLATIFTELHQPQVGQTYVFNGSGRGRMEGFVGTDETTLGNEVTKIEAMLDRFAAILFNPAAGLTVGSDEETANYQAARALHDADPTWNPFQSGLSENLYQDPRYQWAKLVTLNEYQTVGTIGLEARTGLRGIAIGQDDDIRINQLYGLAADGDINLIAASGLFYGPAQPILIEGQPLLAGEFGIPRFTESGSSHSLTLLVDSLAVQELIHVVDPSYGQASTELLIRAASNARAYDGIASLSADNVAESDSLERTVDAFRKLFRDPASSLLVPLQSDSRVGGFANFQNRNDLYTAMAEIHQAVESWKAQGVTFHLVDLTDLSLLPGSDPASPEMVAQTETAGGLAYRYALKELNPFALSASDELATKAFYEARNASGELALYNPIDGTGAITGQYLQDRGLLLAEKLAANLADRGLSNGRVYFFDADQTYELATEGDPTTARQFLFGSPGDERFESGSQADHLYGGAGIDLLIGGGGDDYLQGDDGSDQLDGGAGADTLIGGAGNDMLEGGTGSDVLEGGIGSDTLKGGAGLDTYRVKAVDGADSIEDGDGRGVILFDGHMLIGGLRRIGDQPDVFRNVDGTVMFTKHGNDLVVTGSGPLTIRNFVDGTLGLRLAEESPYAETSRSEFLKVDHLEQVGNMPDGTAIYEPVYASFFDESANDSRSTALINPIDDSSNLIHALGGDDYVVSGGGDDQLYGDEGNDQVFGGLGHDRLFGGLGDDQLIGDDLAVSESGGNDFLDGGSGNDFVQGGAGRDIVFGADGNDLLNGDESAGDNYGGFDDWLDGGSGDDDVQGGAGSDVLIGGVGEDFLVGDRTQYQGGVPEAGGNDSIDAGDGHDQLFGLYGNDVLLGGDGNDLVNGQDGSDVLYGGLGDDALSGDLRLTTLSGGYDTAEWRAAGGEDLLFGEAGSDLLAGGEGNDRVDGGTGDDRMFGDYITGQVSTSDPLYWTLFSAAGDDWLAGDAGNDLLAGGFGADELVGGDGSDVLIGGEGDDALEGGSGDDAMYGDYALSAPEFIGNPFFSTITALSGRDVLRGGAGNDELHGGDGPDLLLGGSGNDRFVDDEPGYSVAAGNDSVFGDDGDDILESWLGDDDLHGGGGNDLLISYAGNDSLYGDEGNDRMVGTNTVPAESHTLLVGGSGDDTYEIDSLEDAVVEGANGGIDTVVTAISYSLPDAVENLTLLSVFAAGVGNRLSNVLSGGNLLEGLEGDDTLIGGGQLYGGPGNDLLRGEPSGSVFDETEGRLEVVANTYVYNPGDGQDIIVERDPLLNSPFYRNEDAVLFGPGIAPSDVSWERRGNDLWLTLREGEGRIVIPSFYDLQLDRGGYVLNGALVPSQGMISSSSGGFPSYVAPSRVERVQFNDGTIWDAGRFGATLLGDFRADTYRLDRGTGARTIIDFDHTQFGSSREQDTILVASDVAPSEVTVSSVGGADLILSINGTSDRVTIESFLRSVSFVPPFGSRGYATSPYQIEQVQFGDGTAWTVADLFSRIGTFVGTSGVDTVFGNQNNNLIQGLDGDDYLWGQGGDDEIDGGDGRDRVYGGDGVDLLSGGLGIDALRGGSGDDTYVFNLGDGVDLIEDTAGADEPNHIRFGEGIAQDGLTFVHDEEAYTLTIQINGSDEEQVQLAGFDPTGSRGSLVVAILAFADGSTLNLADLYSSNHAPIVSRPMPDQQAMEDEPLNLVVPEGTFTDLDRGDVLTYSAMLTDGTGLPAWLSFDPVTRIFGGTPLNSDVAELSIAVTASDLDGLSITDNFVLSAQNVNDAPIVNKPLPDQSASEDSAFVCVVPNQTFADVDTIHGDQLSYSAAQADGGPLPAWLSFDGLTQTFAGTPGPGDAGVLQITVTAIDSQSASVSDQFMVTISGPLSRVLNGTGGDDVLTGGRGDDTLLGLAGNDQLSGGRGNDVLDGGTGIDMLQGGAGHDTYIVDASGDVVTELANEGTDTVRSSNSYTLGANVENLTLTGAAATNGTGNALDNVVVGNSANNRLSSGVGNDRLDGGLGGDTMIGGAGDDTYVVNQVGDVIIENLNEGNDTVESAITYTLGSNIENLILTGTAIINAIGSSSNNVLTGNSGNNALDAGSGNDVIDGGAGNDLVLGGSGDDKVLGGPGDDILNAGSGNDLLDGGADADVLEGGSGDDQLLGGPGTDILSGGSGGDQFTGGTGNDTLTGGSGNDTYKFSRGDGQDTIIDSDPFPGNQDRVIFSPHITNLDLVISRQANDLRLAIHGSSDQITVKDWYLSPSNRIETIHAGNGQTLLSTQVDQLIQAMASFGQQTGLTWDQAIDQRPQEVQTVLAASWH